jgi:hypothetical protein
VHGTSGLGALDQAGARQHVEMLHNGRQRDRERPGDVRHGQLVVAREALDDRASRGVCERRERAVELGIAIVNHVVKYWHRRAMLSRRSAAHHEQLKYTSNAPLLL